MKLLYRQVIIARIYIENTNFNTNRSARIIVCIFAQGFSYVNEKKQNKKESIDCKNVLQLHIDKFQCVLKEM